MRVCQLRTYVGAFVVQVMLLSVAGAAVAAGAPTVQPRTGASVGSLQAGARVAAVAAALGTTSAELRLATLARATAGVSTTTKKPRARWASFLGTLLRQLAKKAPKLAKKLKKLVREGWSKLVQGGKRFGRWVKRHVTVFVALVRGVIDRFVRWWDSLSRGIRWAASFALSLAAEWALRQAVEVIGNIMNLGGFSRSTTDARIRERG